MPVFKMRQLVYENYEIEAKDEEEALEMLYSGDFDPANVEYKEVTFSSEE